jgi:hypothetical protein
MMRATAVALAPRIARYEPVMLFAPSYVMSAKRLTRPSSMINLKALFLEPPPGPSRGLVCRSAVAIPSP